MMVIGGRGGGGPVIFPEFLKRREAYLILVNVRSYVLLLLAHIMDFLSISEEAEE
jgi:hypothetical protein